MRLSELHKRILKAFADNDMNTAAAARSEFMHRNTMIYQLKAIEKKTELNPFKFWDFINLLTMCSIIPSEEVQKIRHGEWEKCKNDALIYWRCTACKECHYLDEPNARYCPHCGAKMEG